MKLFCIKNTIQHQINFYIKPETCLCTHNKPFFCPDNASSFSVVPTIYVKINKLGKHIQTKFAHKYYNQIGIGFNHYAHFEADNLVYYNSTPHHSFDGSSIISKEELITSENEVLFCEFGNELHSFFSEQICLSELNLNHILSHVSSYLTIKIGDLLILELTNNDFIISPNQKLWGKLNDNPLLDYRIK